MRPKLKSERIIEYISSVIVEENNLNRDIVDKVIAFQGEDLLKAFKTNKQIEISGFGKFVLSKNKVNKMINTFENYLIREEGKVKDDKKESMLEEIAYLKSKTWD